MRSLQLQNRSAKKELEDKNRYIATLTKIHSEVAKRKRGLNAIEERPKQPKKKKIITDKPNTCFSEKFKQLVARLPERQKIDMYEIKDMQLNKRNVHFLIENIEFLTNNARESKTKIEELNQIVNSLKDEKVQLMGKLDKLANLCYIYKRKINREKNVRLSMKRQTNSHIKDEINSGSQKVEVLNTQRSKHKSIFSNGATNTSPFMKGQTASSDKKIYGSIKPPKTSRLLLDKLEKAERLVLDKKKLLRNTFHSKQTLQNFCESKAGSQIAKHKVLKTDPDHQRGSLPKIYDFKVFNSMDKKSAKAKLEIGATPKKKISLVDIRAKLKAKKSIFNNNKPSHNR